MRIQEFDYSVDLLQAILWQYDEALNLIGLINKKQEWYDNNQTEFWHDWYENVFNLLTANSFGLSVWSYILDVPLFASVDPESPSKPIWGFNIVNTPPPPPDLENSYLNFENGNFSTRGQIIVLTEAEQRFVLRLRYFQLTTDGAIPGINTFLNYLTSTSDITPNGTIVVLDNFDMTITYEFSFTMSRNLLKVLVDYDLLPRPAGVGIIYTF